MGQIAVYKEKSYHVVDTNEDMIKIVHDESIDGFEFNSTTKCYELVVSENELDDLYWFSFDVQLGGDFIPVYKAYRKSNLIYAVANYKAFCENPAKSKCEFESSGYPDEVIVHVPFKLIESVRFKKSSEKNSITYQDSTLENMLNILEIDEKFSELY